MNGRMTEIARNWGTTIGYAVGGVVAMGLSVVLFATIVSGAITFGVALVVAIVGVILVVMAKGGAGEAQCPSCSAKLSSLSTGSNDGVLCSSCMAYAEGKDGKLWVTDQARIADSALFGAPLPAHFDWPAGCCVCGAPPTRRDPVSVTAQRTGSAVGVLAVAGATGGAITGTAGTTRITVEVPHCDAHKDGAALSDMGGGKLKIRFKSYPYLRAFCQQNNVKPG